MTKHIYAIGVSKQWIELREAEKPPKLHKTEFNKLISKNRYVCSHFRDHEYIEGRFIPVKKMLKFTSLVYTGGKLLQTMKSRKFADLTRIQLRNGGMIQLTPEMKAAVLQGPSSKEDG